MTITVRSLLDETPAATADVRGLICPFSLISARKALNSLSPGQVLEVISDHPETYNDTIPRMCDAEGYAWERHEQASGVQRIVIRKS